VYPLLNLCFKPNPDCLIVLLGFDSVDELSKSLGIAIFVCCFKGLLLVLFDICWKEKKKDAKKY